MSGVTSEQLLTALVVIVALIGVYNAVMTAMRNHREEQERRANPTNQLANKVVELETKVGDAEDRIERLESKSNKQNEELKLILRSQLALLRHGIDGNNIDGLRSCQAEIQGYLVDR